MKNKILDMRFLIRIFVVLILIFFLMNCNKEEEIPSGDVAFHSLIAEKDTLSPGEETTIKASATGINLEYFWSATKGDILGSGAEITYAASPCHIGTNKITCKITSGPDISESKTIDIVVYE